MSYSRFPLILAAGLAFAGLMAAPMAAQATNVVVRTSLGDFEVELFDEEAPQTVANFLAYVRDGSYDDLMVHRSDEGFVIQSGGYKIFDGLFDLVPSKGTVPNEPGQSNLRGTIAMAKRAGDPDSATSQWFINVDDNTFLDTDNGGFTVFGRVTGDGMAVVDAINALQTWNFGSPLTEVPLIDYDGNRDVELEDFVLLDVDEQVDFPVNPGLNDGWFTPETSGQGMFFTVYPDGGNLFLSWFTFDVERPADEATATVGEPGHRWVTAFGPFDGNRAELSVTLTAGGRFDTRDPGQDNQSGYGTIVVEFQDCDNALVNYAVPGVPLNGTVKVERVVKDNVALCEALAEAAATD